MVPSQGEKIAMMKPEGERGRRNIKPFRIDFGLILDLYRLSISYTQMTIMFLLYKYLAATLLRYLGICTFGNLLSIPRPKNLDPCSALLSITG